MIQAILNLIKDVPMIKMHGGGGLKILNKEGEILVKLNAIFCYFIEYDKKNLVKWAACIVLMCSDSTNLGILKLLSMFMSW